jgi:hypothetical protein
MQALESSSRVKPCADQAQKNAGGLPPAACVFCEDYPARGVSLCNNSDDQSRGVFFVPTDGALGGFATNAPLKDHPELSDRLTHQLDRLADTMSEAVIAK